MQNSFVPGGLSPMRHLGKAGAGVQDTTACSRRYGTDRADRQCLKASLTFAPACLVLPLAWSLRPSARRRRLPVTRPALFLAPPLTDSALCAIFLAMLMAG